jgi:tetratricopeptide (TPR) repeat protein
MRGPHRSFIGQRAAAIERNRRRGRVSTLLWCARPRRSPRGGHVRSGGDSGVRVPDRRRLDNVRRGCRQFDPLTPIGPIGRGLLQGGTVIRHLQLSTLATIAAVLAGPAAVAAPKKTTPATAGKASTDLEFEPDNATAGPPTKTLERAIKLYDSKEFFSASIELKKVLDGESGDDAKNKQRAEFFMGKTMYQLRFYAASLAYFSKIVQAGDGHTYHGTTLKWLAALSRVLPETSGILNKIGSYDVAALSDRSLVAVHDELLFLLGRHYYSHGAEGDFDKAIGLFKQVSRDSEFFIKAKFFEGVTYVRKYEGKPAVDAFKEILVIGEQRPPQYRADDIDTYRELAQLQMARVFYSTQQFDTSIKYFEKLDQSSFDWTTSLFEASWAYFMKTLNSKALGNIHTLNAPYFENQFFPESMLLKSVIYYKYCLYDQAEEAVSDFNEKYQPLTKNLTDLVAKYEDNADFYDYVKNVKAGKAGLDPVTQRLVMSVLNDKTLLKTFAWVDELNHELTLMQKADKAWQRTQVASDVSSELTLAQSVAAGDAGRVARDRVARLARELGALSRDGSKIKFEILEGKGNRISAQAAGARVAGDHKEEPIVVDDEHFQWKFDGEYWKDELGYYRFKIRSRCPKK